jgi:hypothetical protein
VEDALYLPAFHPPVTALAVGRDGVIWLRRENPDPARPVIWEAYSPAGELRRAVSAPADLRIMRAAADQVWGVEPTDLDVPVVVRYRVEPPTL